MHTDPFYFKKFSANHYEETDGNSKNIITRKHTKVLEILQILSVVFSGPWLLALPKEVTIVLLFIVFIVCRWGSFSTPVKEFSSTYDSLITECNKPGISNKGKYSIQLSGKFVSL